MKLRNLRVLLTVSTLVILSLASIKAHLVSDELHESNRPTSITRNHHHPLKPIVRVGDDSKSDTEIQTGMSILESTKCGRSATETIPEQKNPHPLQFPWMALLMYSHGQTVTPECDGSLISDRYVLTAAYCTRMENKILVSVQLGDYNRMKDSDCSGNGIKTMCDTHIQEIAVEEAIYHKDFDPSTITFTGDIGLVRLKHKATFDSNVMPICLPITENSKTFDKDWMFLAGWTRDDKDQKSKVPSKEIVPVIKNTKCKTFHIFRHISEKQLCVGEENVVNAYCKGDSGTPLFNTATYDGLGNVRFVQYGITSKFGAFCESMVPHLFVNVGGYLNWIAGNIRY